MAWIPGYRSRSKRRDDAVALIRKQAELADGLATEFEELTTSLTDEERSSMADRLSKLRPDVSELEKLNAELVAWLEKTPENIRRSTTRGERLNVVIDSLEHVIGYLKERYVPMAITEEDEFFDNIAYDLRWFARDVVSKCVKLEKIVFPTSHDRKEST